MSFRRARAELMGAAAGPENRPEGKLLEFAAHPLDLLTQATSLRKTRKSWRRGARLAEREAQTQFGAK